MMSRSIAAMVLALCCACAQAASVFIEDMTWPEVKSAIASGKTVAIYYAGSTEQNGPHMAFAKHNAIAHAVAQRVAEELGNALVYPTMPFAPTGDPIAKSGHMRFPGTVNVSDQTYAAVARDVAVSALAAGFTHVVLMGDHGGGQKALENVARELDASARSRGARVHYVGDVYYKSAADIDALLRSRQLPVGAHAGLSDTAQLVALDSSGKWIRRDKLAPGDGANGVDGDARAASVHLGNELLAIKVRNAVAAIRRELKMDSR